MFEVCPGSCGYATMFVSASTLRRRGASSDIPSDNYD